MGRAVWYLLDNERLSWERPGTHQNGATGVVGITVAVADLERGLHLYEQQLGLELQGQDEVLELAARRARFQVGGFTIELVAPAGGGPVQQAIERDGGHPLEVVLQVRNLEESRQTLEQAGIVAESAPGRAGIVIPEQQALGAHLELVAPGG